jgi:1,2-diacylglycerol 3-beta-galactosyltransferase
MVRRLELVYFDAGGGHRAAANALREVMEKERRPFEIQPLNLQELLDSMDVFRQLTGLRLQDVYNLSLKKGWTLGSPQLLTGMHLVIRLFHRKQVRLLEAHWRLSHPDLVVSLVPNFDRALGESLRRAAPDTPLVTILTDLADYPPHFWIERQPQYFICGSDRAVEQARALGHAPERVFRASGMILSPRFYEIPPMGAAERSAARRAMGFDPDAPVGLVLFGGEGAAAMLDIARRLAGRQLIFICGHNQKLRERLDRFPRRAPVFVEGFTTEIPRYMQLADYFIGKPGPGSISEAVFMHLPVIVACNAWTLPQERFNAVWVREQGVGIVLDDFCHVRDAVDRLLDPAAYTAFRAATIAHQNRAVFEIPEMLERVMAGK